MRSASPNSEMGRPDERYACSAAWSSEVGAHYEWGRGGDSGGWPVNSARSKQIKQLPARRVRLQCRQVLKVDRGRCEEVKCELQS